MIQRGLKEQAKAGKAGCTDTKTAHHQLGLFSFFSGKNEGELDIQYSGILRYVPFLICGGFFAFSILLFAFGPLNWNVSNGVRVYGFLCACLVTLSAGYIAAAFREKTALGKVNIDVNKLHILCLVVFFVIYIPTVYTRTGKLYPDIYTGLTNAGLAYQRSKHFSAYGSQLFEYIRILLGPFIAMVLPVTLFFMPKLSKTGKILGFVAIIFTVFLGISQGINKYCADVTAQVILYLALLFFSKKEPGKNVKHKIKTLLMIFIVCGLFFSFYTVTMRSRVAMDSVINSETVLTKEELDDSMNQYSTMSFATEKEDYFLFRFLPGSIKSSSLFLSSYLTHGYKGLSIAMEQDFSSTYGLGFSQFFRHNILKLVGDPQLEEKIESMTYAGKTSAVGWETGKVWSSFFVFPASDISFLGTILLLFFIGYIWSLSWKDALKTHNPFAIVVFLNLCIMVVYFPANNQLFQGGESFIGFSVVFFAWIVSRWQTIKKEKTN